MLAILFSITTAYFSLYVAASFKLMIGHLIDNTDMELSEKFEVADHSVLPLELALRWISGNGYGLMFVFGDGIVVWRAWAVWLEQPRVVIFPALTLLATFVCSMQTVESAAPNVLYGVIGALANAAFSLSIATNLIAVLLIGFKAYQHWTFMKDAVGVGSSAAGKVLMFLTESGILLHPQFQIINFSLSVVSTTDTSPLYEAADIWGVTMIIFSAVYPSLVILIVYNQHSIARVTEGSTSRNLETHISFARSPLKGTTTTDSIMITDSGMIMSQADNGFQASVARPTEEVPEV
ncbi:hypothetical protein C8J56DRAFT_1116803 [Mycena floridula]|nr:hypothetical protein C8J56DRAFT_1116803 [Mycena floridula]